ncbi:MAG: hypothetical protein UT66_C0038G0009 [candidate division CPR2 bacterium GW2011_GWC1_39_9]|uniref:Uncharacterized protein n=1 Tax=candidate division CPR2 bacterium GW2011_GWC2_39_10 TaxID=1618345 RepID=A0A0G0LMY5_UNCC2|nr:MAG: hypothetical protein UT18_C0024G0007 [candidate division CPR2 bacterium GW2011_GWC2_39_10]KKR33492.1 MAG: hypothetical protein UT66_C0038G0009 [candidate division CPR2 bacterium GW2011_GWC1_39_9]
MASSKDVLKRMSTILANAARQDALDWYERNRRAGKPPSVDQAAIYTEKRSNSGNEEARV